MRTPPCLCRLASFAVFVATAAFGAPGDLDPGFNPDVTGRIDAAVVQPDGRIIIGGSFTHVGGVSSPSLARINPDGTLDPTFVPNVMQRVTGLAVQEDGKILAAVYSEAQDRNDLVRFNPDGTTDAFAYHGVGRFMVQADGKVLVSRPLREPIRLNQDGTVDATFSSAIEYPPLVLLAANVFALTDDGRPLVGGYLKDSVGIHRGYLKRLSSSGSVEAMPVDFGGPHPSVFGATVQADRNILVSADRLGQRSFFRISETGVEDAAFQPDHLLFPNVVVLQADGRILVSGPFTSIDSVPRNRFGRLETDGLLDVGFAPEIVTQSGSAFEPGVVLQGDGRAVIFGSFSVVNGTSRHSLARLVNDAATQSLTAPDAGTVRWLRGGSLPETNQVSFDLSTDRGATWSSLGAGTRMAGGWQRTGLNLPANYQLRARARIHGSLLETLGASPDVTFVPTLLAPASDTRNNGTVSFALPEAALAGSVTLTFDDGVTPRVLTLAAAQESAGGRGFVFDPADPAASPQVMSGEAIPEGSYTVTLSYQDAAGNTAATATATNVTIDSTPPSIGGTFSPLTIATDALGTAALPSYIAQAVVDDGEAVVTQAPADGTRHAVGIVAVTLTATDVAGNQASTSFDVEVTDGTPPTIAGNFTGLTATTGPDGTTTLPDYLATATASDNVGVTEFTQSPLPESAVSAGVTQVTLTALDAAGNMRQRTFDVNVLDGTPPTIGGTFSPLTIEAGPNGTAALPSYTSQAETDDNVAVTSVTESPVAGTPLSPGTTQVTLTAKDAALNETSTMFSVMVIPSDAPVVSPPGQGFTSLVLYASQGSTVALPDYIAEALTNDPNATITQDPPVTTLVGEGIVSVTLTVTDSAGNQGTYTFDVTVLVGGTAVLAQSGVGVPNDANDSRIPAGSTWGTFGVPSISMEGMIAGWMATVKTPPRGSFQGLFNGPPEAPALVLRTGETVTTIIGAPVDGVTFKTFREPAFACEEFAVLATVKGRGVKPQNDTGIWFGDGVSLLEAAREGTLAPGTTARFAAFTSLAMPAPGVVFFVAKLAAPAPRDMSLWLYTPTDGAQLVLREGDPVDVNGTDVNVKSFKALIDVKGSPGHGRYDAEAAVLDVWLMLADGRTALAGVAPDGSVSLYALSGGLDVNDHAVASFGVSSSSGGGVSQVTSLATLALDPVEGITAANNVGVFDHLANGFVAEKGMVAPGAVPPAAKFKGFLDPVAGTNGEGLPVLAFGATLAGAPVKADSGLWAYVDGSLDLLAREDAEPPDAAGTKWKAFTSLSVLAGRGPMFTATLASGTTKVKPSDDAGLWVTNSEGELQLLLREGADLAPGKKLRSFDVLKAIAGSPGQRRAWTTGDASARVIYRALFTDGTSAIVSTAVP